MSPKLAGAADGISIAEPTGTHVGPLPKVTVFTDGVVPVTEGTILGRQQQAPRPLRPVEHHQPPPDLPDDLVPRNLEAELAAPEVLNEDSAEIGPTFVGHVRCESDMENQYVFYRPGSGKQVLVVDRDRNECFFLKWKTFTRNNARGES